MSTIKDFKDVVKGATPLSSTLGYSVLLTGSSGSLNKADVTQFARTSKMGISAGEVLRISSLQSAFITCRGTQGQRCALIWFSIYGSGTIIRLTAKAIFASPVYKFYVNGTSENACIYVTISSSNSDAVAVTSLFGETPIVEKVDALPSDAILLDFS